MAWLQDAGTGARLLLLLRQPHLLQQEATHGAVLYKRAFVIPINARHS